MPLLWEEAKSFRNKATKKPITELSKADTIDVISSSKLLQSIIIYFNIFAKCNGKSEDTC